jgi:hypothetical protein
MIGSKMTVFIVAMAMSTVLSVTAIAAPIAASAQCATIDDSDTTAQGNNANPFQGADELVDDDDEATDGINSQSANNGATVSGSEFQTSDPSLSNSLADNDINIIVDQNDGIANCNAQTDVGPQSNSQKDIATNAFNVTTEVFSG